MRVLKILGGDSGYTYFFANKEDEVYEESDQPPDSSFITRDLDFGTPELKKFNSNIAFFTKNPQSMNVSVAYDGGDYYDGSTLPILN